MVEKQPIVGRLGRPVIKTIPPMRPARHRFIEVVTLTGEFVGVVAHEGVLSTPYGVNSFVEASSPLKKVYMKHPRLSKGVRNKKVSVNIASPAQELRNPVEDFNREAKRLGVPLGRAPSEKEALARLERVAADARDVFPTPEAALRFLTSTPLDSKGRNGIQILQQSGLPGVISKLDQIRFGYSG